MKTNLYFETGPKINCLQKEKHDELQFIIRKK